MNKKCCKCDAEASVCLISIDENGSMSKVNLCETHAKEYDVFNPNAYFIANNFDLKNTKKILSNNCCPHCGTAIEWIEQYKRLGCPHCKEAFSSICNNWIQGFKNVKIHFGKIPNYISPKDAYVTRIAYWEQQMQIYAASEDFEHARICKKKLQALKRKKKS